MQVHWLNKWMLLPYQGNSINLQGELPSELSDLQVDIALLQEDSSAPPIPAAIQSLIDKYSVIFEEPQGLPPSRPCDHAIPLTAGAQPFVIRPYRYSPALKSEIEQ